MDTQIQPFASPPPNLKDKALEDWWTAFMAKHPLFNRGATWVGSTRVARWHVSHRFMAAMLWIVLIAIFYVFWGQHMFKGDPTWPPPTVSRYESLFASVGENYQQVDPVLLGVLATIESCGNPEQGFNDIAAKKIGIMGTTRGLIKPTEDGLKETDLRDPAKAIFNTAQFLATCALEYKIPSEISEDYPSLPEYLVACHRAGGPFAVYSLTIPRGQQPVAIRAYINAVMKIYWEYKGGLPPETFNKLLVDDAFYQSFFLDSSMSEAQQHQIQKMSFRNLCREATRQSQDN